MKDVSDEGVVFGQASGDLWSASAPGHRFSTPLPLSRRPIGARWAPSGTIAPQLVHVEVERL